MFDTRMFYLQLDRQHRTRPHVVSMGPNRVARPGERRQARRAGER